MRTPGFGDIVIACLPPRRGWAALVAGAALVVAGCAPGSGAVATVVDEDAHAGAEAGLPAASLDVTAEGQAIKDALDAILTRVEAGDRDGAAELAAATYLDHYEPIEDVVMAKAPDVNDQLEPLLGTELRSRIQDGATPAELRDDVARAKALVDAAVAAVEP